MHGFCYAFLDVAAITASRTAPEAITMYEVPAADVGLGDGNPDSGLDAFPAGEGAQVRNATRLGFLLQNLTDDDAHFQFITAQQVDGLDVEDRVYTVGAGEAFFVGPFPSAYQSTNYEDSDNGNDQHTDYIQIQFASDKASGVNDGDLLVGALLVPAS